MAPDDLETQLREQIERLAEENRRKDRFLDVLLHELRNPIAAIAMAGEALSRLCAAPGDIQAMADVISRQSLQANRLLDELLDLSRIANGKLELRKERFDLVAGLRNAVANRQTQLDAQRVQVHLQLPASPVWIDADPIRMSEVLGNLIDQSAESTNTADQLFVRVSLADGRRLAHVEIRDTGTGLAPQDLAAAFEPIFQRQVVSTANRGIRAFGLAVAKGLVELHGGTITVESEGPGKGACFRITLPLSDGRANEAGARGAAAEHRPLRILVIDDSPDVLTSLEFLLTASGHSLTVAPTAKQGIDSARRLRPDVVLCDIGLPDMDGYSVAQKLRADPQTSSIYLVAVSGYASDEDQRRSLEAGFDLHLNKPEGFVGLNERLQNLPIGGRQGEGETRRQGER